MGSTMVVINSETMIIDRESHPASCTSKMILTTRQGQCDVDHLNERDKKSMNCLLASMAYHMWRCWADWCSALSQHAPSVADD